LNEILDIIIITGYLLVYVSQLVLIRM